MNGDRRAKVAAVATVVGLGALGGVALGTNHGMTPTLASTANGRAPLVTSTSGATTATAATAPGSTAEARHNPIVTRTSAAAAAGGGVVSDD